MTAVKRNIDQKITEEEEFQDSADVSEQLISKATDDAGPSGLVIEEHIHHGDAITK